MALNQKIADIVIGLAEKGIKADVKVDKQGLPFNKQDCLQILVKGVSDDITASADIQRVLREVFGYGTAKTDYNRNEGTLTMEYIPLAKEKSVPSEARLSFQPIPSSTHYNQ